MVNGQAPETLLDTYHAERHPVGQRLVANTRAQIALGRPDPQASALRELFGDLMTTVEPVARKLGEMITAIDVRYPFGDNHPLVGARVPDVDFKTAEGTRRLYTLLHAGRPVLLDLADGAALRLAADWADRVELVEAVPVSARWVVPVVAACSHQPLSVHVAAARLLARPQWTVRQIMDQLADDLRQPVVMHEDCKIVDAPFRLA